MKKKLNNLKLRARLRRSRKTRATIRRLEIPRLTVHKSANHIYAQLIVSAYGVSDKVLAQASSLEPLDVQGSGKIAKATSVGTLIAERIKALDIARVAFDRSGFQYHGRIKALAEAARAAGLVF